MNYQEYLEMIAATPIDTDLLRAMIKDALSSESKLDAIINMFVSLNVPEDYDGDFDEAYEQGASEVFDDGNGSDIMQYVDMVWAMDPGVSDSVFNTLEQFA